MAPRDHIGRLRKLGRACLGAWLYWLAATGHAAPFTVGVILSDQSPTYLTLAETLARELADANVQLVAGKVGAEMPGANLLLVVGARAADALPPATPQPAIYLLLQRTHYEALLAHGRPAGKAAQRSAIYIEQSPERQIDFLRLALPQAKRVGILHSANTASNLDVLRGVLRSHGLSPQLLEVNEQRTLAEALDEVLGVSDVLFAVPDNSIYSSVTVRNLMFSTYRSGKPLIAYSAGYVKAGASAAVFTTPAQFAVQAAAMVREYGRTGSLPAPQYPRLFEVSVNEDVVRSLGLSMRGAAVLQAELERAERGRQ